MPGKQAKILSDQQIKELLLYASSTRNPFRNRAIVLLSVKAGLRAGEIAHLTWPMVLDGEGQVSHVIELHEGLSGLPTGVFRGDAATPCVRGSPWHGSRLLDTCELIADLIGIADIAEATPAEQDACLQTGELKAAFALLWAAARPITGLQATL